MKRKHQFIKRYLFYNLILFFICLVLSLVIHVLVLLNVYQSSSFINIVIYIVCVYGIIVLFINNYIKYINMPNYKKAFRNLVPEKKLMLWHVFLSYLLIIVFFVSGDSYSIIDNTKYGTLFHTALQLFIESIILSILYWNYKTISYIEDKKTNNFELIEVRNKYLFDKGNGMIIYKSNDPLNIVQVIIYMIFILSLVSFHLYNVNSLDGIFNQVIDGIRNYPYIYIIIPFFFLKGFTKTIRSLFGNLIKFDSNKGVIYYGKNIINFEDVDYIQIRKIKDTDNGLNNYILSIILKEKRYHQIEMSIKYQKIKDLAKDITDVINVSIKEV